MSQTRVVVTGLGCISPVGNDVQSAWENITHGRSGIGPITHFDPSEFYVQIGGQVKDFDPRAHFGARIARRIDRFTQFGLYASQQALENANLSVGDNNRDRIGIIIGTGIGGIGTISEQYEVMQKKGPKRVSPFLIPMMLPDGAAGAIAIELGFRGPNMAVVTACATGTNAVGEAMHVIRRGDADVMLVGGAEAAITPITLAGLSVVGAMSTRNDDPERASRPFDANRDGFVIGEGSAMLMLESLEHAQTRGANIMAEVCGYGTTNDAYHITSPAENGEGAASCMRLALEDAGLGTDEIQYINAHGTSTTLNDKSETAAIKTVFGDQAYNIPVSSTKSMTGHLLGASGALEALFCVQALQTNTLPPTINYETPDPECDLFYVPNQAKPAELSYAMSNSFGFGGHNATIILGKYQEAN